MGMGLKLLGIFYLILNYSTPILAEINPADFKYHFEFYRKYPRFDLLPQVVERHKKTLFIFVTGLMGDQSKTTWKQTIDELDVQLGSSYGKRTFLIQPDSKNSVTENARFLKSKVDEILGEAEAGRKIILSGHSKGAYESWTMLMPEPDFVKKHIAGAIFLQGPFLGSHIANAIIEGRSMGEIQPFVSDPLAWGTRWLLSTQFSNQKIRRGLESLTTRRARVHTAEIQKTFGPKFDAEAHARTLFIKTSVHPDELAEAPLLSLDRAMLTCEQTLQKFSRGPNDGAVKTDHQYPLRMDDRTITFRNTNHQTIVKTEVGAAFAKALLNISPQ